MSKSVSILEKKFTTNFIWIGTSDNMVYSMMYLKSKYNNLCIPYIQYFNSSMQDICVKYICKKGNKKTASKKDYNLSFPKGLNDFIDNIEKCSKKYRFLMVPLFIYWYECDPSEAHFNFMILDLKLKTCERFDPYGDFQYDSYQTYSWFDKDFTKIMKNIKYKYLEPHTYSPVEGFQEIEENQRGKITKTRYSDSQGYCGAWCIYYAELRLKYPDIINKVLIKKIIKKLKENDRSFKDFIKNYSTFLLKKKTEIKKKHNIILNHEKHKIKDIFNNHF